MIESRASNISTYALCALSDAGVCVYICDEKHLPCAVIQPIGRHSRQKKQILSQLPPNGSVRVLTITEKQYESIKILVGELSVEEKSADNEQLSIF